MTLPGYSVVIATYERAADLATLLGSLTAQVHQPEAVVIVDSSPDDASAAVAVDFQERLPLLYAKAHRPSAAAQRNQGAQEVNTPLVCFVDDDAILPPDLAEQICREFARDFTGHIGGIAARIEGMQHRRPGCFLRGYYRWQAGYDHPTYGGKLFGPALNCLPTYDEVDGPLISSDWLNSTCVFYRTEVFRRERFPEFEGYSFLEDVHLSARVGRTHQLFFHRTATFIHNDAPSTFKSNARALVRRRLRHQRIVARELLGLREPVLTWKLFLHRLFLSACLLRAHRAGWRSELAGVWL